MSARVEQELQSVANAGASSLADATALVGGAALAAVPAVDYDDRWGGHTLPNDHPPWMKDMCSISQRARALIAKLRPVVIRVIAAWDHHVRSIVVGNGRLSVDASGSYRLD